MPIGARSAITGFVPGRHPGMGWAWLAAPLVAATGWLPTGFSWVAALAFVIVLGVPHGALDGEIGRAILRPRFGRAWFPMFAVPYLALFAGVLVAWRMAPVATLATFLAASVWHFGADEGGGGSRVQTIALGGLPIALPTVLHPATTMLVFSTIAMVPIDRVPAWLDRAALGSAGKPLQKERWAAAVDCVGSHTLVNVCAQMRYGGLVTACGLAQGMDFPGSVAPFILRGVTLLGIDSVMAPQAKRRTAWARLATNLDLAKLTSITRTIPLGDAIPTAHALMAGRVRGRVVVDLNA